MSPLSFLSLPYEVTVRIALETACIDVIGPPTHLLSLLLTCKAVYATLTRPPDLYGRIFKAKFDTTAARRRFGPIALVSKNLSAQLKSYCLTLQRIRHGDIYAPTLEEDLWNAFFMMMENDGKNAVQLKEYANLPHFVDRLVRQRLHEQRTPEGWPVEDNVKSLSVWLLWMVTDGALLRAESRDDREQLISLILPFVLCCFRYNCFHAADIHYNLPLQRDETPSLPLSRQNAHGPYPQYPSPNVVCRLTHFKQPVTIACPSIVQAAQLLYFARRELNGFNIPNGTPRDRAHALSIGRPTGPTRVDYDELNAQPIARLLDSGEWEWREKLSFNELQAEDSGYERFPLSHALSSRFDADWERLVGCCTPYTSPVSGLFARYAKGALAGRWCGRMLIPDENAYTSMIHNPRLPQDFSEISPFSTMRPFMLTLKEYHCISPEEPVDVQVADNGFDEGVLNAYLPHIRMNVNPEQVVFEDANMTHRYENFVPGRPSSHNEDTCLYCLHRSSQYRTRRLSHQSHSSDPEEIEQLFSEAGVGREETEMDADSETESDSDSDSEFSESNDDLEATIEDGPCNGVLDIVFTGHTEQRHGDAWCHYMYYGRLREWDGLIVLIGIPNDINERLWGKWIFRGYLHGGQNFTGRWRHYAYDLYHPPYEGAFTLSKRND